jgi:SAM-dependent methyltransferase
MLRRLHDRLKRLYGHRISFNDPWLAPVFAVLGTADALVRLATGRRGLPPYAVRVRTNGVPGEFGGAKFTRSAQRLLERLPTGVALAGARVLDLGCSCGRLAMALQPCLGRGRYVGLDIDPVAIHWAVRHLEPRDPRLHFVLAELHSEVYNPRAQAPAAAFRWPFDDAGFDTVIAYSLFTHLLADEVQRYVAEAARCLRAGGRLVFSCFVVDDGAAGSFLGHAARQGQAHVAHATAPRKATGYEAAFLERTLLEAGFSELRLLCGDWRQGNRQSGADQDLYICVRDANPPATGRSRSAASGRST